MTDCVQYAGGLTVTYTGPQRLIRAEDAGELWCFQCRKRLPHRDELWGDIEPSYYEPNWRRICSGCGEDHTYFPGCGPL